MTAPSSPGRADLEAVRRHAAARPDLHVLDLWVGGREAHRA